jgi:hypothetical protein
MMYGQMDSNRVLEKSKGTWRIPIDGVKEIGIPDLKGPGLSIACFPGGIYFSTNKNSDVYSVASGTVEAVICIGDIQGIIIKYGDYYVCYSGLSICYVKKNDKVIADRKIGSLIPYSDNDYRLEVYLSFGTKRVKDMDKWYSDEFRKFVSDDSNNVSK